jgi:Fe-S-cluster containining protein
MGRNRRKNDRQARQDRHWLEAALEPGNAASVDAHMRHAAALLADRAALSCAAVLAHVTALFEKSLTREAKDAIACRKGCAFCCHQRVIVTGAEALVLAQTIQAGPDPALAQQVMAASALVAGRAREEPRLSWLRCPLLGADQACSVYAARPFACHSYVSVDVEDCRKGFSDPQAGVREPRDYQTLRDLCRLILLVALKANGLPASHYELSSAVAAALQVPDAEGRWLKGENIFAGLCVIAMPAEAERLAAATAARISAGL